MRELEENIDLKRDRNPRIKQIENTHEGIRVDLNNGWSFRPNEVINTQTFKTEKDMRSGISSKRIYKVKI